MELSEAQYAMLSLLLPVQRGNVKIDNRQILNTLLYIAQNVCKWRLLSKEYGNWHTIYILLRRWADKGGGSRLDFHGTSGTTLDCDPCRMYWFGQYEYQSASRCREGSKKLAHRPSENPKADGTPKFIWLAQ